LNTKVTMRLKGNNGHKINIFANQTFRQKNLLTQTQKDLLSTFMKYCAYQERCHEEVRQKLISREAAYSDVDVVINELIQYNYLNEERFAKAFAGGKFRAKKWGRTKILNELKFRKISPYLLNAAMKEIDEEAYIQCLE